ncbi:MAG: EAL domain-containing protein, partial [Myxococcota bacterium]
MGFRPKDALATRASLMLRPKPAERPGEWPGPFAPEVLERFESDRALGLVLIDATPLLQIEELAGPPAYLQALETLTQRARTAAGRALGDPLFVARSVGQDAQLLVFVHRDRGRGAFYAEELPAAANEMRLLLDGQLRRVGYPYLTGPLQLGIGHSFVLHRPYQRPETQIRRLIEFARGSARFETERLRRDRNAEFEQILLETRITCHYEPIVRLKDLTLVGYEGLARGPVDSPLRSPIALFETAEGVGLEYELDCLCRELAVRGARELPPGAKLFVNCLPAAVHDPNFKPAQIRQALEGVGLSPSDLVLEVSERQAIMSYEVFRNALTAFTEMGFGIAVDDMGAGYSSLAAALEIRPGFLKIDRSLIAGIEGDPPRQELVRAIQV